VSAGNQDTTVYINKYKSGSADPHGAQGDDTWYRVHLRIPSCCYSPTPGDWNWLVIWHNDLHTSSYGIKSPALGLFNDSGRQRIVLRLSGGLTSSPTYNSTSCVLPTVSYDHWYDLVFHFAWSTTSSGKAEEWVDGAQVCSVGGPTLFTNPDGTISENALFGMYNYHLAAAYDMRADFDSVSVGPTRTSLTD
jgi:hypothetical protein